MPRKPRQKATYPLVRTPVIDKWTVGLRSRSVTLRFRVGATYAAETPEELRELAEAFVAMPRGRRELPS